MNATPPLEIASAAPAPEAPDPVDLNALLADSHVSEVLDKLDDELVGLQPVKARIRDIAALLLVERARKQLGLVGRGAVAATSVIPPPRPGTS